MAAWVLMVLTGPALVPAGAQTIRTIAGTGTAGFSGDGAQADSADFNSPVGVHGDNTGQIWVADTGNNRVRRVTAGFDTVVTYAGTGAASYTGDGAAATAATLNAPTDVFVDSTGNVWVADTGNHVIRKITTAGVISTVAGTGVPGYSGDDSTATSAKLNSPAGVYVTNSGVIYIADRGNNRVRSVSTAGTITTIAGTGVEGYSGDGGKAAAAKLKAPSDVFIDTAGVLYITDTNNHRVRAVAVADSTISTIAGTGSAGFSGDGGVASAARLAFPRSVFVDTAGSVYIADRFNHRVRRINTSGNITTLSGDGVVGASGDGAAANVARLGSPGGVWLHDNRELFIGDGGNHRIRRVDDNNVLGISATTTIGKGREVRIFSAAFTGDGATAVKGIRLTISDLTTATGLDTSDFASFRLYESPDSLFSATDTLRGTIPSGDITLGTTFTVQALSSPVPAAAQRRHYILTAVLADGAVEGHAFRVGFPSGGLSTTIGGHGMHVLAADANRITVDVVATRLLFVVQPDGAISSNPLLTQPVVQAVDDLGFVDGSFTDVVTLTVSGGSGSVLQATTSAVAGIAAFSSMTYVASSDQEPFALIANDEAGGAEGDLPSTTSNTVVANTENDAPVVNAINFTINEDDSVTVPITAMVSDIDDSLSTLLLTFSASHTQAILNGTQLTIRPEANYFGPDTLLITAEDPFGARDSDSALLTIKSVNDRPVLTRLGRRTIDEDDSVIVDLRGQVTDVETPFAGMRWSFVPSAGLSTTFTQSTGLLKAWTTPNRSGRFTLRVTAFDAEGAAATTLDTIDIVAVNDAPTVVLPTGTSIARDSTFVLDLRLLTSDPDHVVKDITFQTGAATGLTGSFIGARLSATPTPGFRGAGVIVIHATDPGGAAGMAPLQIQVFSPRPQAPQLTAIPDQIVEPGDSLGLDLSDFVTDPDDANDDLSWSVSRPVSGSAVITDGVLLLTTTGTTERAPPYTESLTLTVTDPDRLQSSTTLIVRVTQLLPLLIPIPDSLSVDFAGGELLLDLFVRSGVSRETVTWSARSSGDIDVVINPSTRVVVITPVDRSRKGGRILLTATTAKQSASDSVDIHIINVQPSIDLPDLFLDAGESAQLLLDDFAIDDDDVSLLTWTATPLDPGITVSLNQVVRALTLTATEDASGDLAVLVAATDEQAFTGVDTVVVSVRSPPDVPADSTQADSTQADSTQADSTQADSTQADSTQADSTQADSTQADSTQADSTQADSTQADSTQADSTQADSTQADSILVDSTGTNTAPIVGPFSVLTFVSGSEGRLTLDDAVTDDQPVEQLSWTAEAGAGISVSIDDRDLRVTALEGFSGRTTIRVTATDAFGERGSETLAVDVRAPTNNPAAGDFDGSGRVDLDDFFALVDQLGRSVFSPGFDTRFDIDNDGRVGFDDFFLFIDLYEAARLGP